MAKKNQQIEPAPPTDLNNDAPDAHAGGLSTQDEPSSQALGTPGDDELEAQLAYEALKKNRAAKRRKRIITMAIIGVLLAGTGAAFVFLNNGNNTSELATDAAFSMPMSVRVGTFQATVGGTGKAEPLSQNVVTPEVSGIIENLNASVGQQVNQGDVLFTLKNEDLDNEVRKKEEAVETAQRARDTSDRKVDDAYATRLNAWNRANDTNDWSGYDEFALTVAINDAYDGLANSESTLKAAEEDLRLARENADKRTVRAPVSGSIVSVSAQNGQSVGGAAGGAAATTPSTSNGPLIQIADVSQMKITVQINEVDIESIAQGQKATVTFQAIPGLTLDSTVQNIATVSTDGSSSGSGGSSGASAGAGGVVTYAVDLIVPNENLEIRPGMTATVSVITKELENATVVSSSAVFGADTGDPHVLRITDAEKYTYERIPVEVVETSATETALKGDLKDGDQLLATNLEALQSLEDLAGTE